MKKRIVRTNRPVPTSREKALEDEIGLLRKALVKTERRLKDATAMAKGSELPIELAVRTDVNPTAIYRAGDCAQVRIIDKHTGRRVEGITEVSIQREVMAHFDNSVLGQRVEDYQILTGQVLTMKVVLS